MIQTPTFTVKVVFYFSILIKLNFQKEGPQVNENISMQSPLFYYQVTNRKSYETLIYCNLIKAN